MSCKALVHCLSYCPTKALAEHSLHFPFWWDYIGLKPTYATDPTECLTYICIYAMCIISFNICILYIYTHFFYMLYIILLLHARIYTSTVSHGKLFFIPCHGTRAACGSSKQASRTARPDSLMILSIRDNLRLIHWGGGKWCRKGLEKNNQTLDWFLKMSHQKTTSSWPNAAFLLFFKHHFNWLSQSVPVS